jgi:rare lipoprotein A
MKKVFSHSLLATFALSLLATLSGCGLFSRDKPSPSTTASTLPTAPTTKPTTPGKGGYYLDDGPGEGPIPDFANIPNAVPRDEPPHRFANRPYVVFGKTYVPNVAADRYQERGTASWYGKKFHGQKTSSGEIYDMYGMTAAHKTLPLPSYVRVVNPKNGARVVVRVNDRGPFHGDRIIDLSYAAAAKLGIAQAGSGLVEVERVFAGDVTPNISAASGSRAVVTPMAIATPTAQSIGQSSTQPAMQGPTASTSISRVNSVATTSPPRNVPALAPERDGFYVQLGAFGSEDNATTFYNRASIELANVLPNIASEPLQMAVRDGMYRIRVGPYENQDQAKVMATKISSTLGTTAIVKGR